MVSYRFKRDGQYIQRELELDSLNGYQDQVYPESLEEQVDYSAFYDTYYDGLVKTVSHVNKRKNKVSLRVGRRLSSVKEDVTDYYNLQVERHKDYYSDEDSFWMRKQQKRNRKFIKQSIFLALGLLLVFGWYWLTALRH
ncbi:MAG: hypothetical protein ACLUMQ_00260 [Streptococcus salivarius]